MLLVFCKNNKYHRRHNVYYRRYNVTYYLTENRCRWLSGIEVNADVVYIRVADIENIYTTFIKLRCHSLKKNAPQKECIRNVRLIYGL